MSEREAKYLIIVLHLGAPTIVAFLPPGIVMATTIVVMEQTNLQNTANQREEHALEIFSLATMETAYLEYTFAMAITTV